LPASMKAHTAFMCWMSTQQLEDHTQCPHENNTHPIMMSHAYCSARYLPLKPRASSKCGAVSHFHNTQRGRTLKPQLPLLQLWTTPVAGRWTEEPPKTTARLRSPQADPYPDAPPAKPVKTCTQTPSTLPLAQTDHVRKTTVRRGSRA